MNDMELLNNMAADIDICFEEKPHLLANFSEIKSENSTLAFSTQNLIKDEFTSDEEITPVVSMLSFDASNESDSGEDFDLISSPSVRKNRRKASAPQRAIQVEFSQSAFLENSSESSQDHTDSLTFENIQNLGMSLDDKLKADEISEDLLLQDINEDDIFKDLQEEADGENIDEEIIDNVKEEWRAHWGVKCNMCEQVFPFKTEFDKHYITNYNLNPVYTCTFCNKSAEKYSTFRSHCYRHITEGRYKCQECPKGFSLQSMLHVHILAKHTKSKPFMCEECGKSFVTKPGLKIHLKKHKTEIKEDYPCVECGKVLHTRGGLTSHMNVHRLGRRFMCDVCGKTFTQKVNMQQHVKQHTGDKPHICSKCGKTFAEKSHLARHFSFHSEERPYKCEVCQKMYKTERCLKVHSLVHASERPFVCSYCHKGFLSSTKLKQHYNIHTGERPYKCKYCERTFTNYPNWLKHTRRRHKVDHKTGMELPTAPAIDVPNHNLFKEENEQGVNNGGMISATSTTQEESTALQLVHADSPQSASPDIALTTATTTTTAVAATSDQIICGDINLTKAEELFLQQGLFNFPLLDDKVIFNQQQMDFFSGNPSSSVGLIMPYFQTTLPNNQQTVTTTAHSILQHHHQSMMPAGCLPLQLNDLNCGVVHE